MYQHWHGNLIIVGPVDARSKNALWETFNKYNKLHLSGCNWNKVKDNYQLLDFWITEHIPYQNHLFFQSIS